VPPFEPNNINRVRLPNTKIVSNQSTQHAYLH
jgi:hypothetical protein